MKWGRRGKSVKIRRGIHTLPTEVFESHAREQFTKRGYYRKNAARDKHAAQINTEEQIVETKVGDQNTVIKTKVGDHNTNKKNEAGDLNAVHTEVWGHNTVHNRNKVWFPITDMRNKVGALDAVHNSSMVGEHTTASNNKNKVVDQSSVHKKNKEGDHTAVHSKVDVESAEVKCVKYV